MSRGDGGDRPAGGRRALDFTFSLECEDGTLRHAATAPCGALPLAPVPAHRYTVEGDASRWRLLLDGRVLREGSGAGLLADWLAWHVNRAAVASVGRRAVLLHAAAVVGPVGTVVVPARSGSGKTLLAAALVAAGFRYLTDEVVCLDGAGRVRPYRKALAVKPAGRRAAAALLGCATPPIEADATWHLDPTRLEAAGVRGPDAVDEGAPGPAVAAVVVPRRAPGAVPDLQPIGPAAVAEHLLGSLFNLEATGAGALGAVTGLAARCPGVVAGYGEAAEVVDLLGDWLGGAGPVAAPAPRLVLAGGRA